MFLNFRENNEILYDVTLCKMEGRGFFPPYGGVREELASNLFLNIDLATKWC